MVLAFKPLTTEFTPANLASVQGGTVTIITANDTATGVTPAQTTNDGSQDYISQTTKLVTVGEAFEIKTLNDFIVDNGEKYTVAINDGTYKHPTTPLYENVKTDSGLVTTTITDDPQEATIVLVAVDSATTTIADITDTDGKLIIDKTNSTPESGKLYYMAVAVDADGKPLDTQSGKVTATTQNDTAIGGTSVTPPIDGSEDYVSIGTQVNIGEVFEIQTNDDYLAEPDEIYTVKITDVDAPVYENAVIDTTNTNDTVTSTITDNPANKVKDPDTETPPTTGTPNEPTDPNVPVDPTDNPSVYGKEDTVYVKITETPSTIEGGDLKHTVTLVDQFGVPVIIPIDHSVTVTLEYTAHTLDFKEGDLSTIIKTVTIPAGANHKDFINKAIDDFTAEGTEVYTVTIKSVTQTGAFENVAIADSTAPDAVKNLDSTTGTILDGVSFGTPENAIVYEHSLFKTVTGKLTTDSKSLDITNTNSDEAILAFKTDLTTTEKSNGESITYTYSDNNTKITAKQETSGKEVFIIQINQDGTYNFELKQAMDHADANGENDFDLPFEFNIKSNGTTSSDQAFKVTVVDSVPTATNAVYTTKEDTSIDIRLADDAFGDGGKITINGTDYASEIDTIPIYEKDDATKQVGTLKNNGNGTVTFTPAEDYSNHDSTAKHPEFTYTVADFDGDTASATITINVTPVTDTPTVTVNDVTSYEDASNYNVKADGNKAEGGNKIPLGLTLPSLSKDQTDQNTDTGDIPEKNGEITLQFTNGNLLQDRLDNTSGAKLFNGTTEIANITKVEGVQIVIVITSGGTDVDYTYHHKGITATEPSGAIYLTAAEYAGLTIQHAQDNDRDIKIDINVKSFELNDAGIPLGEVVGTLGKTVGADGIIGTADDGKASMIVKILPVTDDISLNWNNAGGVGSFDTGTKTFTFTPANEGNYFTTPINLQNILTKTSGTELDAKPDLDGSEKRTYTVSGIPEGTVITLGGQSATAGSDGTATIEFDNTNNKVEDPTFTMKLPEQFGGKIVNAKITLSVQDMGADNEALAERGIVKTAEVYFNVDVTPVADISTIQVSQAVGYEDAGRTNSNNENTTTGASTIDAPENGIPLNIKVSSDDKDGSETFNVTISDIPDGGAIYCKGGLYNETGLISGTAVTGVTFTNTAGIKWSLQIETYDNATPPKFIPEHNYKGTVILKVDAVTVDKALGLTTSTQAVATTKNIEVIVKDVADIPINNELKALIDGKYVYKGVESTLDSGANKIMLSDFYQTPTTLASYDSSETLSIAIDMPVGFSFKMGGNGVYEIQNGSYVFKASDVGNVEIVTPKHFSGEADIKITYITTDVSDSKTHAPQNVKIYVEPTPDDIENQKVSTIYEDNQGTNGNKLDLTVDLQDTDLSESVTHVKIKASDIPTGFALYLDAGMTTNISTKGVDADGYYVLEYTEAQSIYAKNTTPNLADKNNNFTLDVKYTVQDTVMKNGVADTKTTDFAHTHTVNVQAVTDTPSINATITAGTSSVVSGTTVTVSADGATFTVPVKTTSPDADGSEVVTQIVISGVPQGVTVTGGTYFGYSGSEHNGIWIVTPSGDKKLTAGELIQNIEFTVNPGANFSNRDIKITTHTQDVEAKVETATTTINVVKGYTEVGTGAGEPPKFDLGQKPAIILEDSTTYNLGESLTVANNGGSASGAYAITITDFPDGTVVTGASHFYTEGGKTYYVIQGNGDLTDISTKLSNVLVTPPLNLNDPSAATKSMVFTATVATHKDGTIYEGTGQSYAESIRPVTDDMKIVITAEKTILEDAPTDFSITLSNAADKTTAIIDGKMYIKITENYTDTAESAVGSLYVKGSATALTTATNPAGLTGEYYVVDIGTSFTNTSDQKLDFTFVPGKDRQGIIVIDAVVKNKEGHDWVTTTHDTEIKVVTKSEDITVTPVVDVDTANITITASSTEDGLTVGTLKNAVKVEIKDGTNSLITDGSERLGSIILDDIPNGFVVYYMDGTTLKMATNVGDNGAKYELNPYLDGNAANSDTEVNRNKWLIPTPDGKVVPEIYISAPENWSGNFAFNTKFNITEANLSTPKSFDVAGNLVISSVADAITIDPTLTFGDAFSWVDLKLNANMVDVDGSETMSLKITGLDDMAKFQLANGTLFDGLTGNPKATYVGSEWKLEGITYDQINNIQFSHDKSVTSVGVTASTTEVKTDGTSAGVDDSIATELNKGIGDFKLDIKDANIDFTNADALSSLKNIKTIDLSGGNHTLSNIKLSDVLSMTDSNKELIIKGEANDNISFKNETGKNWSTSSTILEGGKTFDIYTNSGDSSVKVKVEQAITDGITS